MECKVWSPALISFRAYRFNRDIVECKGQHRREIRSATPGFNRDIVECKGSTIAATTAAIADLIETLWNVKYWMYVTAGDSHVI